MLSTGKNLFWTQNSYDHHMIITNICWVLTMYLVSYPFYFIFSNISIRKVVTFTRETKLKAMQLVSVRARILSYVTCTLLKYKTWAYLLIYICFPEFCVWLPLKWLHLFSFSCHWSICIQMRYEGVYVSEIFWEYTALVQFAKVVSTWVVWCF